MLETIYLKLVFIFYLNFFLFAVHSKFEAGEGGLVNHCLNLYHRISSKCITFWGGDTYHEYSGPSSSYKLGYPEGISSHEGFQSRIDIRCHQNMGRDNRTHRIGDRLYTFLSNDEEREDRII